MTQIPIQNNLFKFGGAIGRLWFFLNNILILFLCLIIISIVFLLFVTTGKHSIISYTYILPIFCISSLSVAVFNISNLTKRIIDIQGNTKNAGSIATWILIIGLIPHIGIFISICTEIALCFIPGKITSNCQTNIIENYLYKNSFVKKFLKNEIEKNKTINENLPEVKYCLFCACEIPNTEKACFNCRKNL